MVFVACCLLNSGQHPQRRKQNMEKPLLILVADSNPHVRSFLRRELSASGYQVNIAASVKEIFTNLKSEPSPNLLILDINMPVKIGLEVLARLRKLIPR